MAEPETVDATDLPPIKAGAGGLGIGGQESFPAPGTDIPGGSLSDIVGKSSALTGPTGTLTNLARDRASAMDRADTQMEGRLERDRAERERAYRQEAAGPDSLPPKWDADAERAKRIRGPIEQFGSVGVIFALAASAFTKQPMTTALNAAAGAMQAIKAGDEENYKSAYTAWKDNTELALKRFQMERELFEDANKLATTDINDWRTRQAAIAGRFDNKKIVAMLDAGMDKEVIDIQNAQIKGALEMSKARDEMETLNNRFLLVSEDKKQFMEETGIKNPADPRVILHSLQFQNETFGVPKNEQERLMKDAREQYRTENGGQPMPTDLAIKTWRDIQTSSKALTPDQDFLRRFDEENPNATSEERTKAYGEWKQGQKDNARTEEINRHNKALEDIAAGRLAGGATKEQETERHNKAMEAIAAGKAAGAPGKGPEAVNAIADGIKSGNQPPVLTGLYGMSGPVRAKLQEDGFDLSKAQIEWQRAQKQVATLNGPQMTRFVGLASSVQNTIDEVNGLAKEMDLGGIPAKNAFELKAFMNVEGNSKNGQLAARYIAAVNTLKEEFANLANGGYAPTEPAWALANQQIDGNFGVKQLGASLGEIRRLINYRIQGVPGLSTLGAGAANRYTGADGKSGLPEKPDMSDKPKTVIQNGHTYDLQPDGTYK
jgi:hypothetical protein